MYPGLFILWLFGIFRGVRLGFGNPSHISGSNLLAATKYGDLAIPLEQNHNNS